MSWKPEVIADAGGKWIPNGMAFATKEESDAWALDLSFRWTSVSDIRSVESTEPVNYKIEGGRVHALDGVAA